MSPFFESSSLTKCRCKCLDSTFYYYYLKKMNLTYELPFQVTTYLFKQNLAWTTFTSL